MLVGIRAALGESPTNKEGIMETYDEYKERKLQSMITDAHNHLEDLQAEYRKLVGKNYRVAPEFTKEAARGELK